MFGAKFKAQALSASLNNVNTQIENAKANKNKIEEQTKKEIVQHLEAKRESRARIGMEKVIQQENQIEALEMVQIFCDTLYKKIGLIQSMESLDPTLSEAVSTVIWAAPHLETEVPELKKVVQQLCLRYSKEYGNLCRVNNLKTVNPKVIELLTTEKTSLVTINTHLANIAKEKEIGIDKVDFSYGSSGSDASFDSFTQPSSSCPYPQSNEHFPDADKIYKDFVGDYPSAAQDMPWTAEDETPGNSENTDFDVNNEDVGFKPELLKDDKSEKL
ncbi:IST1 homolog [Dendrobates tinctorius]|uniref:IST1 homolog n=1 Tax=Dendrobates tinctorius TaxID=92724 RepID=UPI003CC9275D